MKHPPIVFIDVETTGGSTKNSRVIDIGAIRFENGKVTKFINQIINPGCPIPYYITNLTGITNDMVWTAPKFSAVAEELESLLHGAIFAAHHVDFDYSLIRSEFQRLGVDYKSDRMCTVRLSRLKQPQEHRHGLDYIIRRMNLSIDHRHRGYDDAEILVKYFRSEMKKDYSLLMKNVTKVTTRKKVLSMKKHVNQIRLI